MDRTSVIRHLGDAWEQTMALIRSALGTDIELLRTTNDSMIRIAEEVGYTASYFDNVFKKYEGVTPRAYRQSWYDSERL